MEIVMVGSIAYDSVESPEGKVEDALGGSAIYGGIASQFHARHLDLGAVGIVGVVGTDFLQSDRDRLSDLGLDIRGIETAQGNTFRWSGSYHGDMGVAQTHDTQLNVFGEFEPKVPDFARNPKILFCANLLPILQSKVLDQVKPRRLSMLDSMNLWISTAKDDLMKVMKKVDLIIINDGEVKMLAEDENFIRASRKVVEMTDCSTLIVKRGEFGVIAFHGEEIISLPAFPTEMVVDPTGCGDSFAGTLASYLANGDGEISRSELREALIASTVTSSFTLESFGVNRLIGLDNNEFIQRLNQYNSILN
ncbi:MAG: sugar kinase [Euryarchaeota archaeon]|nr:sugar kinase [Euryarchaeota archaeon]|tara:strand:- start:718 stop:1638 length:921 start_codon:yes stop_codon:yes gene_type:complete